MNIQTASIIISLPKGAQKERNIICLTFQRVKTWRLKNVQVTIQINDAILLLTMQFCCSISLVVLHPPLQHFAKEMFNFSIIQATDILPTCLAVQTLAKLN